MTLKEMVAVTERLNRAAASLKEFNDAYDAGYDAGVNGSNPRNCHFRFFSSPTSARAWERGKRAGEMARPEVRR